MRSHPWLRHRGDAILALLLFVGGVVVRLLWARAFDFDGLHGQDAYAYFDEALRLAAGDAGSEDFFWPRGAPYTYALALRLFGPTAEVAQGCGIVLGAALGPLHYLWLRRLVPWTGRWGASVAGGLWVFMPQAIVSSVAVMADVPALFFVCLGAWLLARAPGIAPRLGVASALLGGASLGWAVACRWVMALPAALLLLGMFRTSRARPVVTLLACAAAGVTVAPFVVTALPHPETLVHRHLLGWGVEHMVASVHTGADGRLPVAWPNLVFYAAPLFHEGYLTPAGALLVFLGAAGLATRRVSATRATPPALAPGLAVVSSSLGVWVIAGYIFLAGIPHQNFRFGLFIVPPLVLAAGDAAGRRRGFLVLAILAMALQLVSGARVVRRYLDGAALERRAAAHVAMRAAALGPEHAVVLSFELTGALRHHTDAAVLDLYDADDARIATLQNIRPTLVVAPTTFAAQWAGTPLAARVSAALARGGLEPVETIGRFVIHAPTSTQEPRR